jgi:hypothetical protein
MIICLFKVSDQKFSHFDYNINFLEKNPFIQKNLTPYEIFVTNNINIVTEM